MTTMEIRGLVPLALAMLAVLAGSGAAAACNCPKEMLVKEYGSVSQIHSPPLPLPPPLPVSKLAPAADG